jgi:hypothetical protein
VGTGRGLGGVGARQLVEKPVRRCRQAVLVLSAKCVRSLRKSCVAVQCENSTLAASRGCLPGSSGHVVDFELTLVGFATG